jgi:hypothetical protein
MTNVLELVGGMSIAIKVAWVILLLWTCGQAYWYRHGRQIVLPPMQPETRRSASRRRPDADDPHAQGAPV